jgi:hypothetical protein
MASRVTYPALDESAVQAIAALFGVAPTVEPFSPDGSPVYRLDLTGPADGIRLTLWPSLGRVDVNRTGIHGWVMKHVREVEVIEGLEAVFRPVSGEGHLFVSVNGWVNMVIG